MPDSLKMKAVEDKFEELKKKRTIQKKWVTSFRNMLINLLSWLKEKLDLQLRNW